MILGPVVVDNELSDAQRSEEAASNANITTGTAGVPTIVDEEPDVVIYEESYIEVEPDP